MWLLLSLKEERLLNIFYNKRTAEMSFRAWKNYDEKSGNEQELVLLYINVDEFHKLIAHLFEMLRGDNHVETD